MTEQRVKRRNGQLQNQRVQILNRMGFHWEPRDELWYRNLRALKELRLRSGKFLVPISQPGLSRWCTNQRVMRIKGSLEDDRIKMLDAVGFDWNLHKKVNAHNHISKLIEFKKERGHCNVPAKWAGNRSLGAWVSIQRSQYKKGKLSSERIKKLENIGFVWDPISSAWEKSFSELEKFKKRFGHCRVKDSFKESLPLANWVSRMRRDFNKLLPEQRERLIALGFTPSVRESLKDNYMEQLAKFKKRFGHCNVPAKWKKNPKLAFWVYTIRHKRNALTKEDIAVLTKMKFDWDPLKTEWEVRFLELKKLFEKTGKTSVNTGKHKDLAQWATRQRKSKRNGTLNSDRIQLLTSIKFPWL